MRARLRFVFLGAVLLIAGALVFTHFVLAAKIGTSDFKTFAESTVSGFLKAKVHISRIRLDFLNQITLTELEIDSGQKENSPYAVQVEQVVFRYNLLQLLTRRFNVPASVTLGAPDISLKENSFPYGFFQNSGSGSAGKNLLFSRVEMTGGTLRFAIPSLGNNLLLQNVQGFYEPAVHGTVRVDLRAVADGLITGNIRIRGEVDPIRRTHRFNLDLDSIRLSPKIPLPLENLSGKVRLEDNSLYFDEIHTSIHGWETTLGGSLQNFTAPKPVLVLDARVGKGNPLAEVGFKADFESGELYGRLRPVEKRERIFQGHIQKQGMRFLFDSLKMEGFDAGRGILDFDSGEYYFDFEKETQRISVSSNLKGLDFQLNFILNHLKLYGLDLVTAARVHLKPLASRWEDRGWKFQGRFETDYFVFEYAPFEDFKGSFELSPHGLRNLTGSWGKVFQLDGSAAFRGQDPEADFTLRVDGFDLARAREFAARPLPKQLAGLLEGRLKIKGSLRRPEVNGNFKIGGGRIGQLEFDQAFIQLRGFPPYLPLYDSRILKGRTTLLMNGALDLSLRNMFHGVQIQTADKFILWKGWEMNTSGTEGNLEIDRAFANFPTLALSAAGRHKENSALRSETEQPQEEAALGVGPKFKF